MVVTTRVIKGLRIRKDGIAVEDMIGEVGHGNGMVVYRAERGSPNYL